ncbi:unnamed protein product [Acanthoscelides obtectus]|uniref:HMG box domain-containing protein n=1 Tax=Acanthoscelides obtectus TaxID=200917 RepID=A0A9P0Q1L5_ACAOB|nr:unnamed protein product [Acanthoscelides obtectus]CAK1664314.1 Transcription factor A, mitochondrial [Acanthoscelides obtectus]
MAAKTFFTGVLLKSFNFTPNKVLLNNSYRAPLVNTAVLNLRSHASAVTATEKLKGLNIPDKPKRPLSPYLRFVENYKHSVLKENPDIKITEVVKKCAEKWNSMSEEEKQKYKENYKIESEKYSQTISDYNKSLTNEQIQALKEIALEKKTKKQKRKMKKLCKDTNKPKRPLLPLTMYMMEVCQMSNIPLKELMKDPDIRKKWESLPESDRKRYEEVYQRKKAKYDQDLLEWEKIMIEDGHQNAVRQRTLKETNSYLPPVRLSLYKNIVSEMQRI